MIWVNVDIPTKQFVVHSSESCIYVEKKGDATFKGIGLLDRDGGWLHFDTWESVNMRYRDEYSHFELIEHC